MIYKEVFRVLENNSLKISFAESITGGKLASQLVSIKGASKYFELGIIAYSNKAKEQHLKINKNIISDYGPVSKEVAVLMAKNIKNISGSNIGVGVTGNAGPSALAKSEVGDVYLALAVNDTIKTYKFSLTSKLREEVINEATKKVWQTLYNLLQEIYLN